MRVAALYDIHGNLPALEAVLEDVRRAGAHRIVVGGDVIPGPMQTETLARLIACDVPVRFIRGNGEREVLSERAGSGSTVPEQFRAILRWSAAELTPDHARIITRWGETLSMTISGLGKVLFCHATPRSDSEIFTRVTPEETLLPLFHSLDNQLVVCGHTHMQFDRGIGRCRVVNAGSVGMPYGTTSACWLLLGPDVQLRQTAYDRDRAAAIIRASTYPQAEEFAAREVLNPMSEAEALTLFARVELQ
jgi:predicted phosphodiesterase